MNGPAFKRGFFLVGTVINRQTMKKNALQKNITLTFK